MRFFYFVLALLWSQALLAQTFVVDSSSWAIDELDGVLTLPEAVINANTVPGPDSIEFAEGLGSSIVCQSQLVVSESLEIVGPGQEQLTLNMGSAIRRVSMFSVLDTTEDFFLSGLTIRRPSGLSSIRSPIYSSAQNADVRDMTFENLRNYIDFSPGASLLVEDVVFNNGGGISISSDVDTPVEAVVRNVLITGAKPNCAGCISPVLLGGARASGTLSLTYDRVRVTNGKKPSISFYGVDDLQLSRFTLDDNYEPWVTVSRSDFEIVNSIVYLNEGLRAEVVGGAGNIEFSTWFGNSSRSNHNSILLVNDAELVIGHSVMAGNGPATTFVPHDSQVDVNYSMLGSVQTSGDSVIDYDLASTALLTGFPEFQFYAEDSSGTYVVLIPAEPGNLIDVGDPAAVPGEAVPDTDIAGSDRVIGSAPDLGAVERNLPPVFDADGFRAEIKRQISEAPDAVVTVALAAFFSDPDGDAIVEIRAEDLEDGLSFNSDTWELSGDPAIIKRPVVTIVGVDEHGLEGGAVLSSRSQLVAAESGGSGGAPHVLWLLLIAAAGVRQTRH